MEVRIKRGSPVPTHGTAEAGGYDIQSAEDVVLKPWENRRIGTGLYMQMPPGTHGLLVGRSSIGARSLLVFPAVIDSDYTGEVMVQILNLSGEERTINAGNRIAQIVFGKHCEASFIVVDELRPTERGPRGFGSTGS